MIVVMMMMINTHPVIKWCLTDSSAQQGSSEFSGSRIINCLSFRVIYPVQGQYSWGQRKGNTLVNAELKYRDEIHKHVPSASHFFPRPQFFSTLKIGMLSQIITSLSTESFQSFFYLQKDCFQHRSWYCCLPIAAYKCLKKNMGHFYWMQSAKKVTEKDGAPFLQVSFEKQFQQFLWW